MIRRQLEEAREHGRTRLRRLRTTTIGSSMFLLTLCMICMLIKEVTGEFIVDVPVLLLGHVGTVVAGFSLLPSDRRAIPGIAVFVNGAMVMVFLSGLRDFATKRNKAAHSDDCETTCWAVHVDLVADVWRMITPALCVTHMIICLARCLPSPRLLAMCWRTFRFAIVNFAISQLLSSISKVAIGGDVLAHGILQGLLAFCLSLICLAIPPKNVARAQSWLMSRGEAATTAAGISSLLAEQDIEDLLSTSRKTFSAVSADKVTEEAMARNSPDASLSVLVEADRLGQVDAFVSHSWSDNSQWKWAALQQWRENFKANHDGREPKLWIDKYCINQTRIDDSLACLPVYLSGCQRLLVLCGRTYLKRLWCLVEIFIFLEMGADLSHMDIIFVDDAPRNDRISGKSFTSQITSLADAVSRFDPAKAKCTTEYDTDRLHGVIQITGYDRIKQLVADTFTHFLPNNLKNIP